MLVVFVVGNMLAGKDTCADMLSSQMGACPKVGFSDAVNETLVLFGVPRVRENFSDLCKALKRLPAFGDDFLRRAVRARLVTLSQVHPVVLVVGARYPKDLDVAQGFEHCVVGVEASTAVRFQRSQLSGKDLCTDINQFRKKERRQTEGQACKLLQMADYRVKNEQGIGVLRLKSVAVSICIQKQLKASMGA